MPFAHRIQIHYIETTSIDRMPNEENKTKNRLNSFIQSLFVDLAEQTANKLRNRPHNQALYITVLFSFKKFKKKKKHIF